MKINLTPKQTHYWDAIFGEDNLIRIDSPYNEFYYFGGFGSAKSFCIINACHAICLLYPNSHGVFIRGTYNELADSVIPQYLEYVNEGFRYHKSSRQANYFNGTRLDFRAFDKDVKILSNQYDFIVYSQMEEIQLELFLQSLGRNRRKTGGLPRNIVLGEGNPASGWVKTRLKDNRPENVWLTEAKTSDNPYLPPEYEPNLRKVYPAFWIARYLDGEWSNLDEMVFSEFREKEHIIEVLPFESVKRFKLRIGMDYGWINPTAMVWASVDYDGCITIWDEYKESMKLPQELREANNKHGKKIPTICDYSIKRPDRDGRSLWDDLLNEGLNLIESNKQELENIVLVNSLLKQGRLKITRNCVNLIGEIVNYKWKKIKLGDIKNNPETPVDKDNHAIDALLYVISYIEREKAIDPNIEVFKKSLQYAVQQNHPKNRNTINS